MFTPPAGLMNETASWADLFSVMPDVGGWLVVGSGLALVRGAVELGVIARGNARRKAEGVMAYSK
jgi:hypothetical protein